MLDWIAFLCICGAVLLLGGLALVDLKTRLLPNEMVLGLATLAFVFHLTTLGRYVAPVDIFLGGLIGFGMLFIVRFAANAYYKEDALGLGDVKLMGAGGLWLGHESVMVALAVGAMAGMVHGILCALIQAAKSGEKPDFAHLQIPAGPGFAIGIIAAGIYQFRTFNPFLSTGL